jgi:hypothetical protein
MIDKTEGKIEGLVRKIIKEKLDDGQLDLCNLTLKDMDKIAKSFMSVLIGLYHKREVYPEIKPVMTEEAEPIPAKEQEAGIIPAGDAKEKENGNID